MIFSRSLTFGIVSTETPAGSKNSVMGSTFRGHALGLLVVALAATGCGIGAATTGSPSQTVDPGSAGTSPAALAEVLAAARQTMALSASVRLDQVGIAGGLASPSSKATSGSGVIDFAKGDGGEIFLEPEGLEQVVFEPNAIYDQPVTAPGNQAILPQGKRWLGAEPTDNGNYQFSVETLHLEGTNPAFLLDLVGWGAISAAKVGEQAVASEQTAEYQLSVDPHLAASRAAGPTAAAFSATLGYQNQSTPTVPTSKHLVPALAGREVVNGVMTMEIWVNSSGQVAQMQASQPGATVGQITVTMTKFGVSVTTAAPPASQTVDLGAAVSSSDKGDGDLS